MWRAKNQRQRKDKQDIYNSREWKELRIRKLRANPLCEVCEAKGYVVSAHCVHHITPIETAQTKEEMRRLALRWENLQSLCDRCHADIHKAEGKGTAALSVERTKQRQDRWADGLTRRFTTPNGDDGQPRDAGGPF